MRAAITTLLLAAAGCGRSPPAPRLTGVDPPVVRADADTTIAVLGEHLVPRLRADFDAPAASELDAGFAVALLSAGARVALADVAWVDETRLTGRLPAGAASPGVQDLELTDPRGRRALLSAAVTVAVSSCSGWADGTPCDDGSACTGGDRCRGGTCQGSWICPGVNTPPLACLAVTPAAGVAGVTSFLLDASCSTDLQDPQSALQARFLFDYRVSSGSPFDTAFSTGKAATHVYPSAGVFTVAVEVQDTGGLVGRAYRSLLAAASGALVEVTTAADESDPGATPGSPGGTGLSLREAIAYVNGLATTTPQAIAFAIPGPAPHRIVLGSALPALTAASAAIAGTPDVTVDCAGAGVGQSCLVLSGSGQALLGLSLTGNGATGISLQGSGAQVADCSIASTGRAPGVAGILTQAGGTIGPGNEVSGAGTGIQVGGTTAVAVVDNLVHDNAIGIALDGGAAGTVPAAVTGNLVLRSSQSGITAAKASGSIWFNTVDGNAVHGLLAGSPVSLDVRNNLFTGNGSAGIGGGIAGLLPFDHNGYFGNGVPIAGGSLGPTDVTADPLYVNPTGGDYRLLPGSPAINAGVDVGVDVNGPGPGRWDGSAPDLGARESPY